jgi:hypothetical protein
MNLYVLKFRHYSPKDNIEGIITYLVAESSEQVYEWLKSEPEVGEKTIYNSYQDNEDDGKEYDIYDNNYNCIASENFKNHMIRLCGEMFDEDTDVSDAYYGVTHYGWELVAEGVYWTDIFNTMTNLKINIVDTSSDIKG